MKYACILFSKLVVLAILLTLVGCTPAKQSSDSDQVQKNVEVVREGYTRNTLAEFPVIAKNNNPSVETFDRVKAPNSQVSNVFRTPNTPIDGVAEVPFSQKATYIITVTENLTPEDINELSAKFDFEVNETFPELNSILITTGMMETSDVADPNLRLIKSLNATSSKFKSDPRIIAAAPDTLLAVQQVIVDPLQVTSITSSDVERTDWGITNIQADTLWADPRTEHGVVFGVLDAGFGTHEDLIFTNWRPGMDRDDHGNHVSGIACAQHNDRGVRGVLRNCFIQPESGIFFGYPNAGDLSGFWNFYLMFSQTIREFNRILEEPGGAKVYNLSLGYNWIPNFGINPDLPDSSDYRALVISQGETLIETLKRIEEEDIVVYSAAGNDSSGLADPINAKFASPFNWAAITSRERGDATNGVIVEAHDPSGARTDFSNENGHLSCPGQNIVSVIAHDDRGRPSHNNYGTMSGTSMASPYCASGHLLLSLIRPNYTNVELVDCLLDSNVLSSSGQPMLRLELARTACPPR